MFGKSQIKTALLAVGIVAAANRVPATRKLLQG
jgi:hypothetical protein